MSAIDHKAQAAFASVFQLLQRQGAIALADMNYAPDPSAPRSLLSTILRALTGRKYYFPNIVCRAEQLEEYTPGCNVYHGKMLIIVSSDLDEDGKRTPGQDPVTMHEIRARGVFELLFDVDEDETDPVARALLLPYLNAPASGPDNRAEKSFTCSSYTNCPPETSGYDERHVETVFTLDIVCSMGDPA